MSDNSMTSYMSKHQWYFDLSVHDPYNALMYVCLCNHSQALQEICVPFSTVFFHMCKMLAVCQNISRLVNPGLQHVQQPQEVRGWLNPYWKEGWKTKPIVVIGYLAGSQGNRLKG